MSDKYIQDIAEIRQMMEKSSRFISLSGLSGVMAGIYALIGAYVAWKLAYTSETLVYDQLIVRDVRGNLTWLMLDAAAVLLLAIITGVYLTRQKAKKQGVKTWDKTAQQLLINLLIPLVTGGILVVIFYYQGLIGSFSLKHDHRWISRWSRYCGPAYRSG